MSDKRIKEIEIGAPSRAQHPEESEMMFSIAITHSMCNSPVFEVKSEKKP